MEDKCGYPNVENSGGSWLEDGGSARFEGLMEEGQKREVPDRRDAECERRANSYVMEKRPSLFQKASSTGPISSLTSFSSIVSFEEGYKTCRSGRKRQSGRE